MGKKTYVYLAITALVLAIGYYLATRDAGADATAYSFTQVSKGTIENTVSASGTLSPVTTVEIGTQLSGTIASVLADYNDEVTENQVLAILDTTILKTTVLDAEASVERNTALLDQAKSDYNRYRALYDKNMISESEYMPYEVAVRTQEADLKSANSALTRAQRNLELAVITSPVNGIVIEKNVETGQTVAASLSTPTLFVIAEDLSLMEILAEVDESDIGEIKQGQEVRFEVSTYSDIEFTGVVKQVRLQPATVNNVVTYTVVVEADNEDGLLLPGLTATIDFITDRTDNVLMVASKALRFTPSSEQLAAFVERQESRIDARLAAGGDDDAPVRPAVDRNGNGSRPVDAAAVWYIDSDGYLTMTPFRSGISDGTNTEIINARDLTEGMSVITGVNNNAGSTQTQQSRGTGGFGGPPPRGF